MAQVVERDCLAAKIAGGVCYLHSLLVIFQSLLMLPQGRVNHSYLGEGFRFLGPIAGFFLDGLRLIVIAERLLILTGIPVGISDTHQGQRLSTFVFGASEKR